MFRGVLVAMGLFCGCSRAQEQPQPAPAPSVSAVATASVVASALPSASASIVSSAPPVASSAPLAPADVDVQPIGMHIGGGPNDDANKAPLLASLAPHYEALGRCWSMLPGRPRLELGVDADVPAKGGRAKIAHPRSTVKDAAFIACAVAIFEKIEFLPPKSGIDTTVSASVRMSPHKTAH